MCLLHFMANCKKKTNTYLSDNFPKEYKKYHFSHLFYYLRGEKITILNQNLYMESEFSCTFKKIIRQISTTLVL